MGYVAVKAGEEVIRRAEDLFEKRRVDGEDEPVSVEQVESQFSRLVGQVMSEGGLYAPKLAARAVKQAQGDAAEAAFLLRAYRSTLERYDDSLPSSPDAMFATRRVSPAYKDVPGGQILGATKDYTQRLLDFEFDESDPTDEWDLGDDEPESLRNVMEVLRDEGLVSDPDPVDDTDVTDTTREPVMFPAPRDAILQELARGETGAVTALAYSALRGYGQVHPTLGEVRVGSLPVEIEHPYTGESAEVTSVEVTESESVVPVYAKRDDPQFSFGYGLVFGRNERKAIGMTILDASIQLDGDEPAEDAEFVLDTVDGIDSFGFIEHLKLPHYVTFQSILDRIRAIRERKGLDPVDGGERTDGDGGGDTPSDREAPQAVSDDD
ncbi:alpha-D-ribose 1-methylphosphonate 5-triphosphate synthase subunit PhnI [Halogranum rubrum]|uniref:Alpha-D-ribose 1-methylphosphonate 5-triphosphate synthase subunit PhnI n=1 Tax=Halogranum rubrum TaxID=553466 RepID=A0A1I4BIY7_9EURY|nr:carbon-phosphorus lyase complex subunit PhnI [Halogranum rubrum]SFK67896.1 alpha-D-ribose 1-methylphosphonate 5-triphosphate synthase subunit PhnI [Halogranum rubrum]